MLFAVSRLAVAYRKLGKLDEAERRLCTVRYYIEQGMVPEDQLQWVREDFKEEVILLYEAIDAQKNAAQKIWNSIADCGKKSWRNMVSGYKDFGSAVGGCRDHMQGMLARWR